MIKVENVQHKIVILIKETTKHSQLDTQPCKQNAFNDTHTHITNYTVT